MLTAIGFGLAALFLFLLVLARIDRRDAEAERDRYRAAYRELQTKLDAPGVFEAVLRHSLDCHDCTETD